MKLVYTWKVSGACIYKNSRRLGEAFSKWLKYIYGAICRHAARVTLAFFSFSSAENPQKTWMFTALTSIWTKTGKVSMVIYNQPCSAQGCELWPLQVEQIEYSMIFLHIFPVFNWLSPSPLWLSCSSTCSCLHVASIKTFGELMDGLY